MKSILSGILLFSYLLVANAGTVSTPGAIASLTQLPQTQFQYMVVTDVLVMTQGQKTQYTLSVLPAVNPSAALREILQSMQAHQYLTQVKEDTIAGFKAASVHVKQQASDWWMVIKMPELNLFLRVQDIDDALSHKANVEKLVKSVRFAPAGNPANVSGHYTMSSNYSSSYGSEISAYSESGISLQPDGSFSTSSYAGVSGSDVSGYSESEGQRGWWQVRGNRILAYEPPSTFYNYRFEAFSNGLELYDDTGEKQLWVKN
ncbi:MAG: hypothetical protein GY746_04355 [Gammaproteobacteria bacterium]|nr:hypothetical protein [Gammaproteobacteria bacterium]